MKLWCSVCKSEYEVPDDCVDGAESNFHTPIKCLTRRVEKIEEKLAEEVVWEKQTPCHPYCDHYIECDNQ